MQKVNEEEFWEHLQEQLRYLTKAILLAIKDNPPPFDAPEWIEAQLTLHAIAIVAASYIVSSENGSEFFETVLGRSVELLSQDLAKHPEPRPWLN